MGGQHGGAVEKERYQPMRKVRRLNQNFYSEKCVDDCKSGPRTH